jgi:hypothetical protein
LNREAPPVEFASGLRNAPVSVPSAARKIDSHSVKLLASGTTFPLQRFGPERRNVIGIAKDWAEPLGSAPEVTSLLG